MAKVLVFGSGFPRCTTFTSEADELRCGMPAEDGGRPNCEWFPSSVDLGTLCGKSGGGLGAANVTELLDIITNQPVDSIEELRIVGHSNDKVFALGGQVVCEGRRDRQGRPVPSDPTQPNIYFSEPSLIGPSQTFLSAEPRIHKLINRFKFGAQITLAGCGSGGTGSTLLDLVSTTFRLKVAGFQRPIQYELTAGIPDWVVRRDTRGRARQVIGDNATVVRGKVMYSSAALAIEGVLGASALVGSGAFKADAWALTPDAESTEGAKLWNVIARMKNERAGDHDRVRGMEALGRLLAFYPGRSQLVSGVGYSETTSGLIVQGSTIDIGRPYALNTRPATLEQRLSELGKALDLIVARQNGVIPMAP
jgi:hypothetical protein